MKISSYFGEAVRSLAIFRFLLFDNCTLIVEAKTPSQWKPNLYEAPDSERFGSSHFDLQSANIPAHAKGSNSKFRVKKLAVDLQNDPGLRIDCYVLAIQSFHCIFIHQQIRLLCV